MPYRSQAQRRFMYGAEARGDVPKGTAKRWEEHTPKTKLPEKIKKKCMTPPKKIFKLPAKREELLEWDEDANMGVRVAI